MSWLTENINQKNCFLKLEFLVCPMLSSRGQESTTYKTQKFYVFSSSLLLSLYFCKPIKFLNCEMLNMRGKRIFKYIKYNLSIYQRAIKHDLSLLSESFWEIERWIWEFGKGPENRMSCFGEGFLSASQLTFFKVLATPLPMLCPTPKYQLVKMLTILKTVLCVWAHVCYSGSPV